ncbi:MAG TPA: SDR family oxidoreductase [Edaphocola sp.]|nr:SDR family oxidoreductase [Edaphocola sp.]
MKFKNKNVVITGGSKGIGFAAAKAFINEGATVWITGRNSDNLQKALAEINNPKLKTVVSDTSNLEGIAILEKAIAESGSKLDVLFLNAGIASFSPIELATEADFDEQFNTNVKGSYFTLQKLIQHLANGASVLFTSSTNATASSLNSSIYSATKGALNKIAKVAANELADRKIRVNIVSPGPTATPGLENAVSPEAKEYLASLTALQRLGDPDEIAKAVLFLASDDASFITGTELLVDGGVINYLMK